MLTRKKFIIIPIISIIITLFLNNVPNVSADSYCNTTSQPNGGCLNGLFCQQVQGEQQGVGKCLPQIAQNSYCNTTSQPNGGCLNGLLCQQVQGEQQGVGKCLPRPTSGIGDIFGSITAPGAISGFAGQDATGAAGISTFLSNLIELIFALAGISLIFMLLWGAFDWVISEGDKEKVKSAQNKIIHAITGIIIFAIAFAVLRVLGVFTGFKFFTEGGVPKAESQCSNNNGLDAFNNLTLCQNYARTLCSVRYNSTGTYRAKLDTKCQENGF